MYNVKITDKNEFHCFHVYYAASICKLSAARNSNRIVFVDFFISFDRIRCADHEYLVFSLSKYVLRIKNCNTS